jgi:hypothetical protein
VNDTWAKRCCMCGEYARGHGEIPELGERWVCGLCTAEAQWEVSTEHVLEELRGVGTTACHYVIVDLDVDRDS